MARREAFRDGPEMPVADAIVSPALARQSVTACSSTLQLKAFQLPRM